MSKIQNNSRRFHIIIDAFNCDIPPLSDKDKIKNIICKIASLCDMTIAHGPVAIDGIPENPGVTGFAIIDFSHISIHTFTKERELCIDIFSCKKFDYQKVKSYIKKEFSLLNENIKYLEVKYQH
ncbi:MAG: S-adenosylmethionine decarboxylase [Candidatus Blackburnbacteria bacterium]|nr:S-adenosylmethionine decarboxylase [Candidatus Blackburnbacteria bacterium]